MSRCPFSSLILSSILFLVVLAYTDQTVEIIELSVPRFPKSGQDVSLTCHFRLGGLRHRLYTVNWWRGKDQFYTYKHSTLNPKNSYQFKGIHVKVRFIDLLVGHKEKEDALLQPI